MLNRDERERVRDFLSDPLVTMESPSEKTRYTAAVAKMRDADLLERILRQPAEHDA